MFDDNEELLDVEERDPLALDEPVRNVLYEITEKNFWRAIDDVLNTYIEQELFFIVKEVGRQFRWGELEVLGLLDEVTKENELVDTPGFDIFGQPITKKPNFECECPKCKRTLAAARFAPHLEKCMGMGRNSSRIASRRLAASSSTSISSNDGIKSTGGLGMSSIGSTGQLSGASEDEHFSPEEDDEEWTMERKKKTKKGDKLSQKSRKGPIQRLKNMDRTKRGASPSIADSPSSSSLVDACFIDEEEPTSSSFT